MSSTVTSSGMTTAAASAAPILSATPAAPVAPVAPVTPVAHTALTILTDPPTSHTVGLVDSGDDDDDDDDDEDTAVPDNSALDAALAAFDAAKELLNELCTKRERHITREMFLRGEMREHRQNHVVQRWGRRELRYVRQQLKLTTERIEDQAGVTEMAKWAVEEAGGEISDDEVDVMMYGV